jgi:hypothetical protein
MLHTPVKSINGNMKISIKIWFKKYYLDLFFICFLILCFFLVIVVIRDYGPSYDEPILYEYAKFLPSAYIKAAFHQQFSGIFEIGDKYVRYYGTSYLLIGELTLRFLTKFLSFSLFDGWHILNFSTFLLGAYGLFWICKRFTTKFASFIAGILYITQPLLWGHGVMNPKDTPFAALFILAVASGIKMVDLSNAESSNESPQYAIMHFFTGKWYSKFLTFLAIIPILDRVFSNFISSPVVSIILENLILKHDSSKIANWFYSKAQRLDSYPDLYLEKFLSQINLFEFIFIFILVIIIILIFIMNSTTFQRQVLFSGIILGITISIRTLGPAAGVLVLVFWLISEKTKNIIPPLIAYTFTACFSAYLLWPYLWANPIFNYWKSFSVMANFPWSGSVRFEGIDWLATSLPSYYLPKLIGIQLTIPSLILLFSGTITVMVKLIRQKMNKHLLIPLLWFYIPLFSWIIFRPNTYDNFRQFLFIVPPIFILAAIGFDEMIQRIQPHIIKVLICVAILIPGIIAGSLQHPYEYIYYNGFVGWTANIERNYESDYWNTALCGAGKFLDPLISNSTEIAVTNIGLGTILKACINKQPILLAERAEISKIDPDYSVISTRWDDDIDYFRWMTPIYTIKIGNTDLLVIKQK